MPSLVAKQSRRSLARLALSAAVLAATFAPQRSPARAQPDPAPAPPAVSDGRVQLMLFVGRRMLPLSGATVAIASGASAVSDRRGSAFIAAPPGEHALTIEVPRDQLPAATPGSDAGVAFEVAQVRVVTGHVTRVLLMLADDGELIDSEVLAPPAPAELPPGAAAPEAGPAQPGGASGTLTGHVLSSANGAPIAGAKIYVLGQSAEAQTDAAGAFALTVAEGSQTISVVHIDFLGQTLEGVSISAGVESQIEIKLEPAPVEMEDYLVKGRAIRGSVATVLEERRSATTVQDAIGAEDIRKSPDGTASAATRRVVGATVVGGQYLFVRGLGGRYSNVRLNSVPLPSTDPDVPGFQLDLFPASLLSSLTIAKTFTPDIPGDFAGGSMNIATRDFPDRFEVTSSLSLASDTQTIGREMPSYAGGDLDFLGFDDGARELPDEVPDDALVTRRPRFGEGVEREEIPEIGRAFANRWTLDERPALPNLGLGLSVGDTARLGDRRFGYLLTLGYRYASSRYIEHVVNTTLEPEGSDPPVRPRQVLRREVGKESAQIGLLGTASYELAHGHDLTAVSVLTQTGDDDASRITGRGESEGVDFRETELSFVERQLLFNQLLGAHAFDALSIDWQLNLATVRRDQPDTRGLILTESDTQPGVWMFSQTSGSGELLFTELSQLDLGGGANLTIPIGASQLKSGYLGRKSDREFAARRFETDTEVGDRTLPPDELFAPENSGETWQLNELTEPESGYSSEQQLHAGYGLADIDVASWLRLTGGARVESFNLEIGVEPPVPPLADDDLDLERRDRTDTDVLPGGAAIVSLSDTMSVRLAYGGTIARPVGRELSPFRITDFVRRRTITGNLDLERTYIHNFDVRWELFPSATEVLAASVFYKVFLDPIEAVILDTAGNLTFQNIESARNYGAELEARFGLSRIADALEDVVVTANFALIRSRVTLYEDQVGTATSQERPLAGQSPYVANLSLGWTPADTGLSLNLFYNVFGRRISEVGKNRIPDSYEQPFHSLDFTASYQLDPHWTLSASATNLLLQEQVVEQGGLETSRIDRGTAFGVRLGFAN